MGICTKFDRFQPINWSNINIINETNFIQKVSLNYTFSMIISSISTKLWILCSNVRKKLTRSPISQFAIFAKLISLKTIELNRVSIFFHEIFRINVELPDDLKFWSGILS